MPLLRKRKAGKAKKMTLETHIAIWEIAACLLRYPDEALIGALDAIEQGVNDLPDSVGDGLHTTIAELRSSDLLEQQQKYVHTFDFNRRADLHLTYHAHGDKRQRGLVLLRLKRLYEEQGSGMDEASTELPDFLPIVLEFAAIRPVAGCDAMSRFRAPIELIRRSLTASSNPYMHVLDAIVSTMPPLQGDEREAVRRLLANGPPEEAVGLEPYAPHDIMPQNEIDSRMGELT